MSEKFDLYANASCYDGFCREDWSDIDGPRSSRPEFGWDDYYCFRPGESIPKKHLNIMKACNDVYHSEGIIRNTIDLMADFGAQGIRISHPVSKWEKVYKAWWNKVQGSMVSERFLNYLYRYANVIIRRRENKLTKTAFDRFKTAYAADLDLSDLRIEKNLIPSEYVFLNPCIIDCSGGDIANFLGGSHYKVKLPFSVRSQFTTLSSGEKLNVINNLPLEIQQALKEEKEYYPLPMENTCVYFYKKEDWAGWAKPIIYSILQDIYNLRKLKLADRTILDSASHNIRVWKLGSVEHKIAPNPEGIAKFNELLQANTGAGTIEIIWGPDVQLLESNSNAYQYLGEEKYKPHLSRIYEGLGIPPTLTGVLNQGGSTNNFISLKTLIQRLEYGRQVLKKFWYEEIERFRRAMRIPEKAVIEFDNPNLTDSVQEKKLLIDLADRNLISTELLHTLFNFDSGMEKARLIKQERPTSKLPVKRGPFYRGDFEETVKKIALQRGLITVDQLEIGLEQTVMPENLNEVDNINDDLGGGDKEPGRPLNSQDSEPRNRQTFNPIGRATALLWAKEAQEKIDEVTKDFILQFFNKKNIRSLSSEQFEHCEKIRFSVLFNLAQGKEINTETVRQALQENFPTKAHKKYREMCSDLELELNETLTKDQKAHVKALIYSCGVL